jgi:hypothetical protein
MEWIIIGLLVVTLSLVATTAWAINRTDDRLDRMEGKLCHFVEGDSESMVKVALLVQGIGGQLRDLDGRIYNAMEAARKSVAPQPPQPPDRLRFQMPTPPSTVADPAAPKSVNDWISTIAVQ